MLVQTGIVLVRHWIFMQHTLAWSAGNVQTGVQLGQHWSFMQHTGMISWPCTNWCSIGTTLELHATHTGMISWPCTNWCSVGTTLWSFMQHTLAWSADQKQELVEHLNLSLSWPQDPHKCVNLWSLAWILMPVCWNMGLCFTKDYNLVNHKILMWIPVSSVW